MSNRIGSEIAAGASVDIRDKEYIWCKGTIKMIIESEKREPVILVHYVGFEDAKDEVLFRNSPRLAKAGAYTTRKDIPTYKIQQNS